MANLLRLRGHCYAVAGVCFLNAFQIDYLLNDCSILNCLLNDLEAYESNDFIFLQLINFIKTLHKHSPTVKTLLNTQNAGRILTLQSKIQNQLKRATLIQTLVMLMLKKPENLLSFDRQCLGRLF
jgi:hypothetical protein